MLGLQAGWGVEIADAEATFREMDGYRRCYGLLGTWAVGAGPTDGLLFCGAQEQGRANPVHRVLRVGYQAEAAEQPGR